jgi:hypothetical protein
VTALQNNDETTKKTTRTQRDDGVRDLQAVCQAGQRRHVRAVIKVLRCGLVVSAESAVQQREQNGDEHRRDDLAEGRALGSLALHRIAPQQQPDRTRAAAADVVALHCTFDTRRK